jgi:hypothetical protein
VSFDYDKIKEDEESNTWASYSDLFMVLSVVFLLLYVVSALRTGTSSVQNHVEFKRLAALNEDYKAQLATYNNLKNDYVEKGASEKEAETYKNLMDKLSLLKEEAKKEKEELLAKSLENQKKEQALNQYQQIVRNIINANVLAKKRIKRRDEKIKDNLEEIKEKSETIAKNEATIEQQNRSIAEKTKIISQKDQIIAEKQKILQARKREINKLENDIQEKKKVIKKNKSSIKEIEKNLARQLKALEKEKNNRKISQKKYLAKIKKIKEMSKKEIRWIEYKNKKNLVLVNKFKGKIASVNKQLSKAQQAIMKQKQQKQLLSTQLSKSKQILEKQKRGIASLTKAKETLAQDLKRAQWKASLKKRIAKRITDNFKKNGVKAQVDEKTGDVFLTFQNTFFATGSSRLKPKMVETLEKFIPSYTKSLFQDKKISENIKAIEIIGFSSPTYKGKVISPDSLDPADKKAIQYNLDLSYKRARSIFDHVFDTTKFTFEHQKRMLPLVKVSGRSFFNKGSGDLSKVQGMTRKEFCKKYECQKERKVIIKFDLHD